MERPGKLLRDYENLRAVPGDPAIKTSDERREQVSPGWIEAGRKNEQVAWESVRAAVLAAEQRAAEVMSAPVQDHLVGWWRELGGVVA